MCPRAQRIEADGGNPLPHQGRGPAITWTGGQLAVERARIVGGEGVDFHHICYSDPNGTLGCGLHTTIGCEERPWEVERTCGGLATGLPTAEPEIRFPVVFPC